MQKNNIKIRFATIGDSKSLFDWRSDENSRAMSFSKTTPSIEEHNLWFENALSDQQRTLFIGECGDEKIGVCRFDADEERSSAEVSINMNPASRGRGLGKQFLREAVERYLEEYHYSLIAKVKPENLASLSIFKSSGFDLLDTNEYEMTLKKDVKQVLFKEVGEEDADILLALLAKREHAISHKILPSHEEHLQFMRSKPYRHWALVFEDNHPVGTFYLQNDNSIGLNLLQPQKQLVQRILRKIQTDFAPLQEVKSKIPPYFYINVPYANEELKHILGEIGATPIQTSFKL